MFRALGQAIPRRIAGLTTPRVVWTPRITTPVFPDHFHQNSAVRAFHTTNVAYKTNTSTRTKENVHDLETFLKLIGRNSVEHLDSFEGDLDRFLATTSSQMKNMGIDVRSRRYLLRWKHKFVNDLEPLREHKRGKKKNGGERNARLVKAKRHALKRLEEKESFQQQELEAEAKGERDF